MAPPSVRTPHPKDLKYLPMNDLAQTVADRGLRHVLFSFTDLFGVQRAMVTFEPTPITSPVIS